MSVRVVGWYWPWSGGWQEWQCMCFACTVMATEIRPQDVCVLVGVRCGAKTKSSVHANNDLYLCVWVSLTLSLSLSLSLFILIQDAEEPSVFIQLW